MLRRGKALYVRLSESRDQGSREKPTRRDYPVLIAAAQQSLARHEQKLMAPLLSMTA